MRKSKPQNHGRFSVSCLVHVSVRRRVLFIGRQLQNFCDKDITNSSTDKSYTERPIENQTQTHSRLKDLPHVRVGYGYDLIQLFDISDTWSTDYYTVFDVFSSNCPYVAYGGLLQFVFCMQLVVTCVAFLTSPQIYMELRGVSGK